ncbi:MAG: FtsX-like permease family protein [Bacteroidales bacterium]|nr:FtsX-like permease family protein [Bacteroidales bacterium]MBQ8811408.1 FtsX-like permease family protein [Bacteroidales bacterium]
MKSYLRFLSRNRLYTAIEMIGLSISMAFVILIGCHIWQHISIRWENDDADRIYTVGLPEYVGLTYGTAEAFASDIPDIELHTRYMVDMNYAYINGEGVKVEIASVDPAFFDMFPYYEVLHGSLSDLESGSNAFVSREFAEKISSDGNDIIGQIISIYGQQLTIVGIIEDFRNTLFKPVDILINATSPANIYTYNNPFDQYGSVLSFFKVKKDTDRDDFYDKIEQACRKYYNQFYGTGFFTSVELIRLDELFFSKSNTNNGTLNSGDGGRLSLLFGIGLLLLLSAVFNYINLNFALTGKRAKEMATRRLLGEYSKDIFLKYIVESIAFTALCLIAGVLVAVAVTPTVNQLLQADIPIAVTFTPGYVSVFIVLAVIVGTVSGILPAALASRYEPIDIIRGTFRIKSKMLFSKVFIVIQNAIAVFLIVMTLVMETQMRYTENRPTNCNTEDIFDLGIWADAPMDGLVEELRKLPCVKRIGRSSTVPVLGRGGQYSLTADGEEILYKLTSMDTVAFDIFGLKVRKDFGAPVLHSVWFTEKAFNATGFTEEYYDISQTLSKKNTWCEAVAGIIETFPTNPSNLGEDGLGIVCILGDDKLKSADIIIETLGEGKETRQQIMDVYSEWSHETFGMYVEPYMRDFVDEYIAHTVQKDTRNQMRLIEIFMLLAVMISLLGLVAMSTYYSETQSKDIAVRKVYGGTIGSETIRNVSSYMAMVMIASVIGVPLAVWTAQVYLQRFTYRIEGWWWIPLVAVVIALIISLCAVLWQTLGSARTNPAEALKKE